MTTPESDPAVLVCAEAVVSDSATAVESVSTSKCFRKRTRNWRGRPKTRPGTRDFGPRNRLSSMARSFTLRVFGVKCSYFYRLRPRRGPMPRDKLRCSRPAGPIIESECQKEPGSMAVVVPVDRRTKEKGLANRPPIHSIQVADVADQRPRTARDLAGALSLEAAKALSDCDTHRPSGSGKPRCTDHKVPTTLGARPESDRPPANSRHPDDEEDYQGRLYVFSMTGSTTSGW